MNQFFIHYFRRSLYLIVLIGFNFSHAGSYDDFFKAIKIDDVATVRQLLARGFDVNTLDPRSQHGLIIAIREQSPRVAQMLVEAPKVDLNLLTAQGESPLMLAALKGQTELAAEMIKRDADVNKPGWTPLHYAASGGHLPLMRLLLENYAYIDAASPNGTTPLMMASMYGNAAAVQLLLEEGADPLLKNQQALTALEFAQRANRLDSAALIAQAIRSRRPAGQW